jgi:putative redox protein
MPSARSEKKIMVMIEVVYSGSKKCTATHQEGVKLQTDAPKDIGGDASAFSPTDLVAAALASCILTTMGMFAERHGIDLSGSRVEIQKEMISDPMRRIGSLKTKVMLPGERVRGEMRKTLERVAETCPVHKTLHPDVKIPIEFAYE